MSVATEVLLVGALYALEQCGLLLTDAAALLEQRRFPTSAAIALFAREELGRHKILLDLWRKSAGGSVVTPADVDKTCADHVEKQRRGGLSLMYRMEPGDQMDKLVRIRLNATPGTEEWRAAQKQIELIDARHRNRQPHDRHEDRMSAIYVDLAESDTWSRPRDLVPQECADEVQGAINDYINARLRIEEAATVHQDRQLDEAVAALSGRPILPPAPQLSMQALLPSSFAKTKASQ